MEISIRVGGLVGVPTLWGFNSPLTNLKSMKVREALLLRILLSDLDLGKAIEFR